MSDTNFPVIKTRAAVAAVEAFIRAKAQEKALKAQLEGLRVELVALMGGAPVAYVGKRTLTATDIAAVPDVPALVITRAMVGTVLPAKNGRKAYVQLRIAA